MNRANRRLRLHSQQGRRLAPIPGVTPTKQFRSGRVRRDDAAKPPQVIFEFMKGLILVLMMLMTATSALAGNLYRYENDQGVMVINSTVPPEFVHKGYDVLSSSGRLIQHVPRALSKEELAIKSAEEQAAMDKVRQDAADKKLLTIFSSPEDAERARDRKIEAIDVYINVTKGNILKLQGDFNIAQSQAAERERAGQTVPDFLVNSMDSLRRQIEQAEVSIGEKEKEKDATMAEYAKDIDRLHFLLDKHRDASEQAGINQN